ncbi:hypothetical protein niasHS_004207 [Heterodera schachtii]|uniref:arabinogalactan endo-beta-1,4-galactanase n=2 Tax=Heterodera TaxID=34509 RepID=A0ABD2JT79_HETSC
MASLKLAFLCHLCLLLVGIVCAVYKGADISFVTQQEKDGQPFLDSNGKKTDLFALMKSYGMNAVRLRVWVNPAGGWCNKVDTLNKAKRAKAQGMALMIDFHYADSWADPGQQPIPSAWKGHSLEQLVTDVYKHTYEVLNYLKSNGISVLWVQIGNEINNGMLWPIAKTPNYAAISKLINSGYKASKAVYPNALRLRTAQFNSYFEALKKAGTNYDAVGISHYPNKSNWQQLNAQSEITMKQMISKFGKKVVVAEIGMKWSDADASEAMLADMFTRVKAMGNNGIGVFYWEPNLTPDHYEMGAMDSSGKFTKSITSYNRY